MMLISAQVATAGSVTSECSSSGLARQLVPWHPLPQSSPWQSWAHSVPTHPTPHRSPPPQLLAHSSPMHARPQSEPTQRLAHSSPTQLAPQYSPSQALAHCAPIHPDGGASRHCKFSSSNSHKGSLSSYKHCALCARVRSTLVFATFHLKILVTISSNLAVIERQLEVTGSVARSVGCSFGFNIREFFLQSLPWHPKPQRSPVQLLAQIAPTHAKPHRSVLQVTAHSCPSQYTPHSRPAQFSAHCCPLQLEPQASPRHLVAHCAESQ